MSLKANTLAAKWATLMEATKMEKEVSVMGFGKYKGCTYDQVVEDKAYVTWFVQHCSPPANKD